MKNFIVLLIPLLATNFLFAQSFEGTVEHQKKDQKAMVIEFPYAPSIVEDAIVEKMERLGYKKKESKGFLVYKGAVLNDISSEAADYMIKIERKSRKEKDESTVYLLINQGEENVIARNDALVNSNARTFLNNLVPHVDAFNLEKEIVEQEGVLGKAEKKLRQLIIDQQDMEKKIRKLQDQIVENTKDQEDQQKQIEAQRQTLDSMKNKRKA